MNKIIIFKIIPYLACIFVWVLIYLWSTCSEWNLRDLLINISAAFLVIPLLYVFYEVVKSFSEKKLNVEILDYAKMQVDSNILSIMNQLEKIIFPKKKVGTTWYNLSMLLSLKKENIENTLSISEYLGFQVFTQWDINEKWLHELLKNSFILKRIWDKEIITIIKILKRLGTLKSIRKWDELYIETNKVNNKYQIKSWKEINESNEIFPDRYLLLEKIDKEKYIVSDFWDIYEYDVEKCLKYYKVNQEIIWVYSEIIYDLIEEINLWIDKTGGELIINTNEFKVRPKMK